MKKLLSATAAIIILSPAAYAADAVVYYDPTPTPVADTFSWTGGYVGVNAGYSFGKFKYPITLAPNSVGTGFIPVVDMNISGVTGGAQVGYNWQSGAMVYGVEADIQASALDDEKRTPLFGGVFSYDVGTKVAWYGSLRARLGYTPIDRLLIYATGGLAYGSVKSFAAVPTNPTEYASKTKAGFSAGAGIEYALGSKWTIKTEYLYTDLGKTTLFKDSATTIESDVSFNTVRVGLNYRF